LRCGRRLRDELFDQSYRGPERKEIVRYMINEFDRCPMRLIFRAAVGELFVTPQQRDERGRDPLPPPSPRRSGLAHARGREPMQPADAYRHNLCAIGPGRVLVNPDFIDVERLPPILKHWDVLIGPDRIGGRPGGEVQDVQPVDSINGSLVHRRVVVEASRHFSAR
jgi:glycine amidinotransferase